mmetsp:Transcript_68646/g.151155  ORF Transcript_68646/g.151155 Transcript_68646/m.151155 type:complete len:103 (+) Transcript_68646:2026-2334(+)
MPVSQSRKQISDDSSKSGCCVCLPLMDFPSEFHLKFHIFDVQFPCTADWDLQQSCVKGPEGFSYTDCETLLSEAKISLPLEECAIRIVQDDSMCTSFFLAQR